MDVRSAILCHFCRALNVYNQIKDRQFAADAANNIMTKPNTITTNMRCRVLKHIGHNAAANAAAVASFVCQTIIVELYFHQSENLIYET